MEIFDADRIKPTQVRTHLVEEILSPVSLPFVQSGDLTLPSRAVLRPFRRLGESPLKNPQAIPLKFHPLGMSALVSR
jgi:hypothetical protein